MTIAESPSRIVASPRAETLGADVPENVHFLSPTIIQLGEGPVPALPLNVRVVLFDRPSVANQ